MFGSPYYPAGVTDEMIDKYFGGDGSCCNTCRYFSNGVCSRKENDLEDMADEEYDAMSEKEKDEFITVDKDDYCDDFDWKDDEYEEYERDE